MPISGPVPVKGKLQFIETFDSRIAGTVGTLTVNRIYMSSVQHDSDMLIASLKVFIGTASGNIDVGILTFDGTTFTRVASSGSTAAAGTNAIQTLSLLSSYQYRKGTAIYLAFQADNGTVTILRNGAAQAAPNGVNSKSMSKTPGGLGILAASPITGAVADNITPWIAAA